MRRLAIGIPAPKSLTYQHIFAVINTFLAQRKSTKIKILDAGCGNGNLVAFLYSALQCKWPQLSFEIYGYDVLDHGVQQEGFFCQTIEVLGRNFKDVNWRERLKVIAVGEDLPFDDDYFDIVVSNQVLEHIHDKVFFFKQIYRVLMDGGQSIHLAPLAHCVWEGHVYLPFAHWILSHDALRTYIYLMSVLGFGKFLPHSRKTGISAHDFSERHADYIYFWTRYSSELETLGMCRSVGFRASFRYSKEFYLLKIRHILRLPLIDAYNMRSACFGDSLLIKALRYISSVTLVCEKRNVY